MLHRLCFSFRCRFCSEMQGFTAVSRTLPNRRPKAATYLCRFAAKARFDNRLPRVRFPKGRAAALPFGRFKERGFLRGEGNRNPSPLKWRSLDTFFRQGKKVTRRRHPAPGRGTPRSTQKKHPRVLFCFASSSIMLHQPRQQQRRQQPQQLIQHHGQRCQ